MSSNPSIRIRIRPATEADAAAIAKVHHAALARFDKFYNAFFERPTKDLIPLSTQAALQNPNSYFVVAVLPDTGTVVGFIRYHVVEAAGAHNTATTKETPKPVNVQNPAATIFTIKGHMKDLWERFGHPREDEMDECYEKAADGQRHIYVKHIMVDPDHQRKGIGAKLLRTVIDVSDAEKIPTFIVASIEGYCLYQRLGFEDLGTWTIDNDLWSKEIVRHERQLGIKGNEMLAEEFEHVREVEKYMVRWQK